MNITSQVIMDKHNKALTCALTDNDGKPKRAYAGVYYVAYGGYVALIEETTRYGQVVWDSRITTTLGRDNETLLVILMGKPDETYNTLKDSVVGFIGYVEYYQDYIAIERTIESILELQSTLNLYNYSLEQLQELPLSNLDLVLGHLSRVLFASLETFEDKTMPEQTDNYDIEQLQGYYVGYAGKIEFYGKDRNEVIAKLNEYYAPSTHTVTHLSPENVELSIENTLAKRDEFVKQHYGYETFKELQQNSMTSAIEISIYEQSKIDIKLSDFATELSDMRKQLSHMKQEHRPIMRWVKPTNKLTYGEPAPLFYEYPKQLQSNSIETMNYYDRVIMFKDYESLVLSVDLFVLKNTDMSVVGLHEYNALYYRFHGFNSPYVKNIGIGKRTNKRANDNEVSRMDSTIGVLRDNKPQSRKQRKARNKAHKQIVTNYQLTEKHYDTVTINGKSKTYVCSQLKQNGRIVYTQNGLPIWQSSKTVMNYVSKMTGCPIHMIPTSLDRITNFVYMGKSVIVTTSVE